MSTNQTNGTEATQQQNGTGAPRENGNAENLENIDAGRLVENNWQNLAAAAAAVSNPYMPVGDFLVTITTIAFEEKITDSPKFDYSGNFRVAQKHLGICARK